MLFHFVEELIDILKRYLPYRTDICYTQQIALDVCWNLTKISVIIFHFHLSQTAEISAKVPSITRALQTQKTAKPDITNVTIALIILLLSGISVFGSTGKIK